MGFFSKIFSFFNRVITDLSDSQKSSKDSDASIDTTSAPKEDLQDIDNRDDSSTDVLLSNLPMQKIPDSQTGDSSGSDANDSKPNLEPNLQPLPEQEEESYIARIRREEEERKKREWLEFLKTKRAKRRKELEEELVVIDKQLTFIQERILAIKEEKKGIVKKDTPDILLNPSFPTPRSANQFNERKFERIITMRELLKEKLLSIFKKQRRQSGTRTLTAPENV